MIERKHFTGGMDAESAPDFIAPNDYIIAENCRMFRNELGGGFAFKEVNGTTLRLSHENVAPKYTIGSITDEAKGRVYFFMYHGGTGQDHTIWCWDRKTSSGYRVLRSSHVEGGLSFDRAYPVTGLALIGDYLFWTDDMSQPRMVNVERGIRTNHPTYISQDGTTPEPYELQIQQHDISIAKRAPVYPLTLTKIVSEDDAAVEDRANNFIENSAFQFAYRFLYRDDQYSVVSPYSYIAPHNGEDDEYDTIKVELPKAEPIENEVKALEFLVRRGNTGSFSIIKTFDRREDELLFDNHNSPSSSALSYYFFNDVIGVEVPDAEAYVPFYDVPLKSKSLEIAQNRLFLANNLKGYAYPSDLGITLSLDIVADDIIGTYYLLEILGGGAEGDYVVLLIPDSYGDIAGWYETPYTASQFNTNSLPVTPAFSLSDRITPDTSIPPDIAAEFLSPAYSTYDYTEYTFASPVVSGLGVFANTAMAFRPGVKYEVGVVFYDFAGRNAGVVHDPEEILIPAAVYEQDQWAIGINYQLQNTPAVIPTWAESYAVVRTKSSDFFIQFYTRDLKYGELEEDGSYTLTEDNFFVDTFSAIGIPVKELTDAGIGYTYSEGDLVRLIDSSDTNTILKVIGTQGNYVLVEPSNLGSLMGEVYFVEIYRPIPPDGKFYEVGANYKILNPGTSTRALSVDEGTLRGDTFLENRSFYGSSITIQTMNRNNKYWFEWPQDIGRVNDVIFSSQTRYGTEVAWGGVFFPGTETNDLSSFLTGDVKSLDEAIGPIQKLSLTSRTAEYGTVLLAVGKTEAASAYLGRTEMYNATEGSSIVTSAAVIGTVNVLRGGFGTLNPESFVENDGDAYWFSAPKASFVRYNRNGVVPISDYKFAPVAKWLADKILLAEDDVDLFLIPGGFDEYNKEYLFTMPVEGSRRFPLEYDVLEEMDEAVTIAATGPTTYQATLEAGELYKLVVEVGSGGSMTITLNDQFFGSVVFSGSATTEEVQFFAPTTGVNTFSIIPFGAAIREVTLYKQRLDPYVFTNNVPRTFAFSEVDNRWKAAYRFVPDWFGKIADVLVSFKNAILYTHDDTANKSRFYGIQYKSWFSFAANAMPNVVKRFQGISMETDTTPDYVHIRTEYPNLQSSDVVQDEFSVLEGVPYASFRKDGLSPNVAGTRFAKQAKGDDMVGRWAKILVEFGKNIKFVARMVNITSRPSRGHKL